ncbi:hypothetical protein O181_035039 [Austropuccinia psidii MF-1]|uniref:Uncharacterized protein n=1 Tax=Austropuccinia psidii MF-1 TaxID=1389203 RepID=A0A9Q3HA53_9BASI|nr:hypothetical protein [Austropuccinia psidii MF-1]
MSIQHKSSNVSNEYVTHCKSPYPHHSHFWVITYRGARQQFGILIFVLWMTPSPLPDHLTPLPCLLSHMNWLLHHLLIISSSSQDMLPLLPLPLQNNPSLRFHTPTTPSQFPPMLPPHICPHPSLRFRTPA